MNFCISGSSGFIGQALSKFLLERGHNVTALSRKATSSISHSNYRFVSTDYSDSSYLADYLSDCQALINLASPAHFNSNHDSYIFDHLFSSNLGLSNLISASKLARIDQFIHLSSAGVLGKSANFNSPFTAFSQPRPYNVYTMSKANGEILVSSLLAESSVDYVILRPPLVYSYPCPGRFNSLVRLVSSLPFLPLASLANYRSFISLDSLLSAIYETSLNSNVSNKCFVVSDKNPIKVSDLIDTLYLSIRKLSNRNIHFSPFFLSTAAKFLNRSDQWDALSLNFIIDPSDLEFSTNWRSEDTTLTIISNMFQ